MELKATLEANTGMNTSANHCFGGPGNAKTGSTSRICKFKKGKISKISRDYIVENGTWDYYWEETLIPQILSLKSGSTSFNTEYWDFLYPQYLFKILETET
ncbi:hypothetical protein O181_131840 [Austropuccinia psidii MF-1]|uniref:Uncharacterized protein n=1 Tax=Austropuccinia psidii MF-1 TaxID=1389203 RepID=A0A9Q3L1R0_9BASI|nr:hypothetical protein [Austropuccinia psidii MF-1]